MPEVLEIVPGFHAKLVKDRVFEIPELFLMPNTAVIRCQ
jgi:hypothetical protein